MKHLNLLLVGVLLAFSASLYAQISHGGKPVAQAQSLSLDNVPTAALSAFDLEAVMAEDAQDEKMGNYPKIGRVRPVDVNPATFGEWMDLEDGGRLWRAALKSRDALGLSVHFEDFDLPNGAKLFLYSPDMKHVIGSFTDFNNHESGIFSTQIIPSDEVVVEYYEPASAAGSQPFRITGLVHCYRMVPGAEAAEQDRDFGDSDFCQVNVNCSEGNSWQDEKRGVARILIVEGQFAGWCTGSLVNNTAQDCTPYFLTALHCGENASASNMNQWIFYFNYESSGCSNGSSGQVPNNTVQGCSRIADSGDGGGNSGSDFMLVEFNNDVPAGYNAYYNGWSVSNSASPSGVSIHHPAGDIKKISTYTSSLFSTTWGGPSGTHWLVQWSSTANGFGVTEGGSSGSPIFNNQGLIVGTLTGGSSFCNNPTSPDLYGKMSYHWNSNPGDDLDDFLDPTNSGVTTLAGSSNPCAGGGCAANIPYPESDPCVQTVIAADSDCCDVAWDTACEDAYQVCAGGGGCEAGNVSVALSQDICPGETGVFDATGIVIPSGGGYAVQFVPDGGTGGNGTGFSITGLEADLPWSFDDDLNGILSSNSLPPLEGTWLATGLVYEDPDDFANTICSATAVDVTLNFLAADDPACAGGGCAADIPYPESDPCVQQVIAADAFCCDDTWDQICEDAYTACNGGGDCVAGDVSVALTQNICPGETGIFDATGVTIPDGGGYGVAFTPDGGTGGNGTGFTITGLEGSLPWEFDDDLNGILSANTLPPLEGTWVITGIVFSDVNDFANTICDQTVQEVTLNFLAADDPLCNGGGDDNDACADAITITPGSYPFSTATATTDGPDQPGSDCDAFNESNVNNDIWYEYTATCDGTASLSTCGTADFDTRLAVYPAGQCPPTAGSLILCNDDFDGCADFSSFLEWDIVAGTTYLLRVGGYSDADAGSGTIELVENCDGPDCVANIPYPETDPCVQQVIADDPFCCDNTWDGACETAYQDCIGGGSDACLDWVDPSPTTGWNNFNTDFGGAPVNDGLGCPFNEIQDFEVWMSEAYAMDNVVAGTSYTFSHCNGPGAGSWVPNYTIIAPSGTVDAFGAGDGDGCSITWTASESGSYLIVINEAGNCGNAGQVDNGYPAITCNDPISSLEEVAAASFGIFPNPNTGQFSITYSGEAGLAVIEVLEVSGKVVKSAQFAFNDGTVYPVDLGEQATGMYFVRITMNDNVNIQKVMVR